MSGWSNCCVQLRSLTWELPVCKFGPDAERVIGRSLTNKIYFRASVQRLNAFLRFNVQSLFDKAEKAIGGAITPENGAATHTAKLTDQGTFRNFTPELDLVPVG